MYKHLPYSENTNVLCVNSDIIFTKRILCHISGCFDNGSKEISLGAFLSEVSGDNEEVYFVHYLGKFQFHISKFNREQMLAKIRMWPIKKLHCLLIIRSCDKCSCDIKLQRLQFI